MGTASAGAGSTQPHRRVADAVVVGGGAVGLCAALHLQSTGRQVTLIDRATPGDGASGHNAGIFSLGNCVPTATPAVLRALPRMLMDPLSPLAIRWSYLPRLSPWLLRFVAASRPGRVESASIALTSLIEHAMAGFEPFISAADSNGTIQRGGFLYGYDTEQRFARDRLTHDLRTRRGIHFDVLDGPALAALDPVLAGRFAVGVHLPQSLFVWDPQAFAAELADRFVRSGGEIRRAEVRGFQQVGDAVRAVETSEGRVPTELVVVAAGAWSRMLAGRLGTRVPLDTERGYGVHLPNAGIHLTVPITSIEHHFALTPAGAGGLRLAGTDELAGLAAPPDYRRADRLIEAARLLFPELRTDGATKWMSFRPSLPDSLPVIGPAVRQSNVYLAFGHGHVGLTLAGITGRLIRELVDGKPPTVDLAPFDPARFSARARRVRRRATRVTPGAA